MNNPSDNNTVTTMPPTAYPKTGYLNRDLKMFHICDTSVKEFPVHYHDFHKLIVFLSGNISYYVEGKTYHLQPYDIVLLKAGDLHRPVIHDATPYDRMIVYISSSYFASYHDESNDLFQCFQIAKAHDSHVIRIRHMQQSTLSIMIERMLSAFTLQGFAQDILQEAIFTELLVWVNRALLTGETACMMPSVSNQLVLSVMEYINQHLEEPLTIELLATQFHLHRSYLMHLFKAETSYTIGEYLTEKRLFISRKYMKANLPLTEISFRCGFPNYQSFYNAFVKKYGKSPKQYQQDIKMI